ncbi:MAG: ribonuclease P protein component [Alphaproteobacteria bacterium]|nr:ribonuclease P protein component [Alphaproteobacteria bacterium]
MPPLPHPADSQPKDAGTAAFRVADCGRLRMPPILRQRAEFLAAARARRQAMPGFLLQARQRDDHGPARIGFTCSKKIGNAVVRNRAKRRLREVARLDLHNLGQPGWDYVLIGRPEATISRDFAALRNDFARAMRKIHQ